MLNTVEIFLVEDDQPLQSALTRVLSGAGYAVTSYSTAESMLQELSAKVQAGCNVCVLMDVNLESMNGIAAQKVVRQIGHEIPVIFMSAQQDAQNVNQAWRDGASNFLFKPFTPKELLSALNDTLSTIKAANDKDSTLALRGVLSSEQLESVFLLTPSQRQVLKLVATGLTHQKISEQIGISPRTVKLHRAAMMQRLNCKNVTDLVRIYDATKHLPAFAEPFLDSE